MKKSTLVLLFLVLVSLGATVCVYPLMPEEIAVHWNCYGEVDGFMSRFWGLILFPLILTGIVLLFLVIPRIDPLARNIEEFREYYDGFAIVFCVFLLLVQAQVFLWNLGWRVSPLLVIPPACGLLFFYVGVLLEHAKKRNWFVGIRTPWTLSSERVWIRTHRLGGKLFKVCALVSLLGLFFESVAVWLVVVPVLATSLALVVYSFLEYRREKGA